MQSVSQWLQMAPQGKWMTGMASLLRWYVCSPNPNAFKACLDAHWAHIWTGTTYQILIESGKETPEIDESRTIRPEGLFLILITVR